MPLFEYACQGCGKQFEAFVTAERAPACPGCHGEQLRKLLSSPGLVTAGNGSPKAAAPAPAGCRAQGGHCGCGMN
jgi:putative FmdB family regulatory protein